MERNFMGYIWTLWTPVPITLRIYVSLQVKPRFIRKECQLRIHLTFNDKLYKPTTNMNPVSRNARLQGVRGLLSFYKVWASEIVLPFLH
jgi:hypothetical protein